MFNLFEIFNIVDYLFFMIYLAGLAFLAIYLKRRASSSIQDYFIGANKIPWWAMGLSGMTSQLDMTGTMILVSMLFMFGLQGMYIEIRGGLALVMAFAMVYMGKWNRRSGCMTVPEWMEYRFGSGFQGQVARLLHAVVALILAVGMLSMFIRGTGLFLSIFLPYSPATCALIMIILATIYTVLSGFYGVVFTDIFQAVFIVVAMLFVSIFAFTKISDNAAFAQMVENVTGNQTWMATAIPIHADMPQGYEGFEKFAFSVFFYILLAVFMGMSTSGGRPHYFGARNERECGTQTFVWITCSSIRWPLIIGLVVLGFFLVEEMYPDRDAVRQSAQVVRQFVPDVRETNWNQVITAIGRNPSDYSPDLEATFQSLLGDEWGQKLQLINYHGMVNSEQVLPAVIRYTIPSGLRGLLFIALIAAGMSTFDSMVNMAAGIFVRDIYQRRLRPSAHNKELIRASHITCVMLVTAGFILGYYTTTINEIWSWIMMGLGGGMAMPGLLRWYWWRFNGVGYAGGLFAGVAAAILQRIFFPTIPVWYSFPMITGVSLIASLAAAYLSAPTDRQALTRFYRTTRPFGLWGVFRKELSEDVSRQMKREHRNDIISLFFAVPWQFLLYWTPIQLVIRAYENFFVSLILLVICSIGLYIFWYRNLPSGTENTGLINV